MLENTVIENAGNETNLDGEDFLVSNEQEEEQIEERPRGTYIRPDGKVVIGRVGAPAGQQATSGEFYFTFPSKVLVENTQIVTCESEINDQLYTFYGLVTEVFRQSRQAYMSGEADEYDEDLSYRPKLESNGFNTAQVSILRVEPAALIPPRERSDVFIANEEEAQKAYEADEIDDPLTVGLIKNGGSPVIGKAKIDLDYLLGKNGGHMNVNGAAGRGTKSSFLLFVIYMLLALARRAAIERPSDDRRPLIVPIIFNVKGQDLFYIDKPSRNYKPEKNSKAWEDIGIKEIRPFENVKYFAAQGKDSVSVPVVGRSDVKPYSWSLSDIIEKGLFRYLFAETDVDDMNFGGLVSDVELILSDEKIRQENESKVTLNTQSGKVKDFKTLTNWVEAITKDKDEQRGHHQQTWKKFYKRLRKLVYESGGVLRYEDQKGNPLEVVKQDTSDPIVIDLNSLAGKPELQRFVVATVLRQLIDSRTGTSRRDGLRYLIMLDELNRFAPRGAKDPITRLIELVASEMRSQGLILLGAQQQASKVSEKIIENAGIRVLGKTGTIELEQTVWKGLSKSAKRKAESLRVEEKLIIQDNFREPLHVHVPMPIWAMNPEEVSTSDIVSTDKNNLDGLIEE